MLGSIAPLTAVLSQIDATATLEDGTAVPAGTSLIVLCAVIALVLWSGIHGAFVKPYILVSVMRRYIEAGRADTPQVDVYETPLNCATYLAGERPPRAAGCAARPNPPTPTITSAPVAILAVGERGGGASWQATPCTGST